MFRLGNKSKENLIGSKMKFTKTIITLLKVLVCALSNPSFSMEGSNHDFDYADLDHIIRVESLRSGNHDKDGQNEYAVRASLIVYKSKAIQLGSKGKSKKKIEIMQEEKIDEISTIAIEVLKHWAPPKNNFENYSIKVTGDQVRKKVSQFMFENNIEEKDVNYKISLSLVERPLIPYFQKEVVLANIEYDLLDNLNEIKNKDGMHVEIKPKTGGGFVNLRLIATKN